MSNAIVVSLSNFKGGVGKTTLTILLSLIAGLARLKTLVIDLDPQCNSTIWHSLDFRQTRKSTITEAISRLDARSCISGSHLDHCDLLAGGPDSLRHHSVPIDTLSHLISPISREYDLILLDCPAMINNLVVSAWSASDRIIAPARLDRFDRFGLPFMAEAIAQNTQLDLEHFAIVVNFAKKPKPDEQFSLELEYQQEFEQAFPNLYPIRIPQRAWIREVINRDKYLSRRQRHRTELNDLIQLTAWAVGRELVLSDKRL